MKRPTRLLLIDDGERFAAFARRFLRSYEVTHAHDLAEAQAALAAQPDFDAILLDLVFELPAARLSPASRKVPLDRRQRQEGLAILAALRPRFPSLPVILMTSQQGLYDEAARALVARDESLVLLGEDAFDARAIELLLARTLAEATAPPADYSWGQSEALRSIERSARTLAPSSLPILILGETGSGKGALAERVLHPWSRRTGPFVALDLAAIPATLAAAELFGTVRGAFSGAVDRPGRLEAAHHGTLFLDEIGNLPLDVQRLLLRSLEEGAVTRLGEARARAVDVRMIAATNADLAAMVRAGSFRADLLARLNPRAHLTLPPLRERAADLPELVERFTARSFTAPADRRLLTDYARHASVDPGPTVALGRAVPSDRVCFVWSKEALRLLARHPWPGNLRELQQVVATASVVALGDALGLVRRNVATDRDSAAWIPIPNALVQSLLAPPPEGAPRRGELAITLMPQRSLRAGLRLVERQIYERLYAEHDGDFAQLAQRLLGSGTAAAARRVRLRFNQLGLRVRNSSRVD